MFEKGLVFTKKRDAGGPLPAKRVRELVYFRAHPSHFRGVGIPRKHRDWSPRHGSLRRGDGSFLPTGSLPTTW